MLREVIEWIDVTESLPDDDTTVLVCTPADDHSVWPGWHSDDKWYSASGFAITGVKRWAKMPSGDTDLCQICGGETPCQCNNPDGPL